MRGFRRLARGASCEGNYNVVCRFSDIEAIRIYRLEDHIFRSRGLRALVTKGAALGAGVVRAPWEKGEGGTYAGQDIEDVKRELGPKKHLEGVKGGEPETERTRSGQSQRKAETQTSRRSHSKSRKRLKPESHNLGLKVSEPRKPEWENTRNPRMHRFRRQQASS
ncbi:hypothetical protein C8R44DRAFT_742814 [Mycena epipterygia]|nr:hypothetical protein C8R44DRAFT_742814 [Mycena epipterygia]